MHLLSIWSLSSHFQKKVLPSILLNRNIKIVSMLSNKESKDFKLKNVIFSPHRAGALDVAFKNMGEIVIKDLKLISGNLKPLNCKKAEQKTVKKITSAPVKIN